MVQLTPPKFTSAPVSVSPLVDLMRDTSEQWKNRDIGSALKAGGYKGASDRALDYGELNTGVKLAGMGEEQARQGKADQMQYVGMMGKRASAVEAEKDPSRRSAMWSNLVANHKRLYPNDELSPEEMDPMTGPRMLMAEAGIAGADPRESQMADLDLELKQATIDKMRRGGEGNAEFQQRAAAAASYGLDPNSDAGRSYILTGRLPREDQQALTATDKKAILEADEMVGLNRSAINAIDEAKRLNAESNAGWFANTRAQIGANLPDVVVPDFVSSPESSRATLDYDNAVVGQALTQLKTIFGGNPTEGERSILLELQGSSGKPREVRAEILNRARRAAENRLKMNEQRAGELRGGTYYKPGGGSATVNPIDFESGVRDAPTPPPSGAVQLLRSNPSPEIIEQFDMKYGRGSAQRYIGQR